VERLSTVQEAREACGGSGFLAENRMVGLHQDLDVYVTFEGDNNILLQLVGKRLLADYARQFKGADAAKLASFAAKQTAGKVFHGAGLRGSARPSPTSVRRRARSNWAARRAAARAARGRVEQMISDIAGRLRPASAAEAADLFNANQAELIEAACAHGELLQWEAFSDGVAKVTDAGTAQVLTWLRDLFGMHLIEKHLAWYLINGRLSTQRAASVSRYIDRLVQRLRLHAQDLVDAYGFAPARARPSRRAPSRPARTRRAYYAALAASGEAPTSEKSLKKK
jgi:acyl-CoA oxidase